MVRKNWATADIFLDMNLYFYGYQRIISLINDIFFSGKFCARTGLRRGHWRRWPHQFRLQSLARA